jgi:hypothetical protein
VEALGRVDAHVSARLHGRRTQVSGTYLGELGDYAAGEPNLSSALSSLARQCSRPRIAML